MESEVGSLECLVDYLACTFHDLPVEEVTNLFGPGGEWVSMERGARGYRQSFRRGDVTVLHDGAEGMGVHVEATGQGCRQLEAEFVKEWPAFLKLLETLGASFTRVDVAFDDRAGLLSMEEMAQYVRDDRYSCRMKREVKRDGKVERRGPEVVEQWSGGRCVQHKITFGKRASETFLRIYDKAAEQGVDGHWVRVELEMKGDRAKLAVWQIIEHGVPAMAGVLRSFLEFKEPTDCAQRTYWKPAEWWLRFLEHAEKARLTTRPAVRTVEKAAEWVRRQCAPVLALLALAPGYGAEWIAQEIDKGGNRLRKVHIAMLEAALVRAATTPEVVPV